MSTAPEPAPAGVAQFFGHFLYEHYQEDGFLLCVTSDASALHLEPGDFIVKREWSTGAVPYIHRRAEQENDA